MRALVTGATGFLGGALARRLSAQGAEVTATGRNLAAGRRLVEEGIHFAPADLADAAAARALCAGQEIVFHCAAKLGAWGPPTYRDYYTANVTATENILQGCAEHGVGRLVYVSTPSIYFRFAARRNVAEDAPLPQQSANVYAATKLLAEERVDRAHAAGLPVITLRPRGIFGPGDTQILPRFLALLDRGRLRIVGDGKTLTDLTYIDNAVDAMMLCASAPDAALGKKYNITNGEPVFLWEKIALLCRQLGYPPLTGRAPFALAFAAAGAAELYYALLRRRDEPPLTRYSVSLLARSMTLDISAARRDLGYVPRVGVDEGLARFVAWWKAADHSA